MSEDNLSPKYFEGKPCKKCGLTRRYVSTKNCVNCKHKSDQGWYQQNSEKTNKQSRKWQQANPEKNRENHLKWLKANPEKVREQNHKRDLKRRENNCERYREIHRVALEKSRAKRNQAEGYYTTQEKNNMTTIVFAVKNTNQNFL